MDKSFPNLDRLKSIFHKQNSFARSVVVRSEQAFGSKWCAEFDEMIGNLFSEDQQLEKAIAGYTAFAFDWAGNFSAGNSASAMPSVPVSGKIISGSRAVIPQGAGRSIHHATIHARVPRTTLAPCCIPSISNE